MDNFVATITTQGYEAEEVRHPKRAGYVAVGEGEALLRTTKKSKISALIQPSHTDAPGIAEYVRSQTGKSPRSGRGSNSQ